MNKLDLFIKDITIEPDLIKYYFYIIYIIFYYNLLRNICESEVNETYLNYLIALEDKIIIIKSQKEKLLENTQQSFLKNINISKQNKSLSYNQPTKEIKNENLIKSIHEIEINLENLKQKEFIFI